MVSSVPVRRLVRDNIIDKYNDNKRVLDVEYQTLTKSSDINSEVLSELIYCTHGLVSNFDSKESMTDNLCDIYDLLSKFTSEALGYSPTDIEVLLNERRQKFGTYSKNIKVDSLEMLEYGQTRRDGEPCHLNAKYTNDRYCSDENK